MNHPGISSESFLNSYQAALDTRRAALFIGAGTSMASGYASWVRLLGPLVRDLGLDAAQEPDLVALAQYVENQQCGRGQVNQHLVTEFSRDVRRTAVHKLIAQLPIDTIWTTNYDHLIEDALIAEGRRVDRKITEQNLAVTKPDCDVTLYKMHGDVQHPDDTVLLKQDYETYRQKRPGFAAHLHAALTSRTFLFLGFSFTDPNIDYFLAQLHGALGANRPPHFWITARPRAPAPGAGATELRRHEYETRKQLIRIDDLKRYGIQTLLIDDYQELPELLRELLFRARRHNIFVAGSAADHAPLGRAAVEELARQLGRGLVRRRYHLLSALGLGIGAATLVGALEQLALDSQRDLSRYLTLRPFQGLTPSGVSKDELERKVRTELLSKAGFAVFLCGNKRDSAGNLALSEGVLEEFAIARAQRVYPIPIGSSGHAAQEIWQLVDADFATIFADRDQATLRPLFQILNGSTSLEELCGAVFQIIHTIAPGSASA